MMTRKNRKYKDWPYEASRGSGWHNDPYEHKMAGAGLRPRAHARQDTMFGPPTHDELAEVITIKNPELAEKSLDTLSDMFEEAPQTAEDEDTITKSDIIHAVQLASNRAEAFLDRENLSEKEEKEMKEVSEIYDEWVDDHEMTADGRDIKTKTISKKKWRNLHKDSKLEKDNGQKYIMEWTDAGTSLIPVKIEED